MVAQSRPPAETSRYASSFCNLGEAMIDFDGLKSYINSDDLLTSWEGNVGAAALDATRITLRELASGLIAIGGAAKTDQIGKLFTECIDRLNALDSEHEFICTIEREDLCEEFYVLGELCQVSENVDDWLSE